MRKQAWVIVLLVFPPAGISQGEGLMFKLKKQGQESLLLKSLSAAYLLTRLDKLIYHKIRQFFQH